MLKNKEVVVNQQKIITQLEQQLHRKSSTIDYLTAQLTRQTNQQATTIDLLDIDTI